MSSNKEQMSELRNALVRLSLANYGAFENRDFMNEAVDNVMQLIKSDVKDARLDELQKLYNYVGRTDLYLKHRINQLSSSDKELPECNVHLTTGSQATICLRCGVEL